MKAIKKDMKIKEMKRFSDDIYQPSGWTDNEIDYTTLYALIDGKWYNYNDLSTVVGENYDGSLMPIKQSHIDRFTEESFINFFSI